MRRAPQLGCPHHPSLGPAPSTHMCPLLTCAVVCVVASAVCAQSIPLPCLIALLNIYQPLPKHTQQTSHCLLLWLVKQERQRGGRLVELQTHTQMWRGCRTGERWHRDRGRLARAEGRRRRRDNCCVRGACLCVLCGRGTIWKQGGQRKMWTRGTEAGV